MTSNTSSTLHSVMSGSSFTPYGGNTYTYTLDGSAAGLEWVTVEGRARCWDEITDTEGEVTELPSLESLAE